MGKIMSKSALTFSTPPGAVIPAGLFNNIVCFNSFIFMSKSYKMLLFAEIIWLNIFSCNSSNFLSVYSFVTIISSETERNIEY